MMDETDDLPPKAAPDGLDVHGRIQAPDSAFYRACDRLFLLGLLSAVCFVLWLPVFPTGDGPVHLYYANVLWSLLQHQPAYAHDYAVRHLFAPYLVHYLALVSFGHFAPPPVAEKLFIAIIFLTQGFGFRFLARILGPIASIACVWMLPLLFSWSLGGGFLNCCFATGVVLWSFGVWALLGADPGLSSTAASGARSGRLLVAHVGLLAVLVLSHPVPLMVLLLFTAGDLLLRLLTCSRAALTWKSFGPRWAAFALTCGAFLFPVLLAQKGQAAAVLPEVGFHLDVLGELAGGMRLGYFAGLDPHRLTGWAAILARVLLVAIVPGTAALLACQAWRRRSARDGHHAGNAEPASAAARLLPATAAGRLLLISIVYLVATAWFPRSLNHSFFFPQRMWNIVWLLVLACGSAASFSARGQRWLAGLGVASVVLTAASGLPTLAHIARAQQQLAAVPLPAGGHGLLLGSDATVEGHGSATTYPVYFWAGARAFAASHSLLLNSPWLGLTILPLRDAPRTGDQSRALLDQGFPSVYSENPVTLAHVLREDPPERERILARADFFLYVDLPSAALPSGSGAARGAPLTLLGDSASQDAWQCRAYPGATLCTRKR